MHRFQQCPRHVWRRAGGFGTEETVGDHYCVGLCVCGVESWERHVDEASGNCDDFEKEGGDEGQLTALRSADREWE